VIAIGKNPAFQFYPSDWTRDLDDQDLEVEGAWIRIICRLWWSETKGEATKPLKEWARILRKTEQKTIKIFQILIEKHIADGSVLDNQNVTIISRRMKRSVEISKIRYEVGLKGGNPVLKKTDKNLDNQDANQKPRSSSSSSSSKIKTIISKQKISFQGNRFQNIPEDILAKWREVAPGVSIPDEIRKAELWVVSNPDKKRSKWTAFLSNWMVRAQTNYVKYGGNNGRSQANFGDKRTSLSDRQRDEDARLAEIARKWEAAQQPSGSDPGRNAEPDDVPDFQVQP